MGNRRKHLDRPGRTVSNLKPLQLVIPMHDVLSLDKKMTALIIPNAVQVVTRDAKYTFASFMARDTTFDVIYNVWRLARPPGSGLPSTEDVTTANGDPAMTEGRVGLAAGTAPSGFRKATTCACGTAGEHYSTISMDVVLPGTPEKIYNLMFASGFIKDFMRDNQKLMGVFRCDRARSRMLTRCATLVRHPDLGLAARPGHEAALAQHDVHQAAERADRPEADQVRDQGRDRALRDRRLHQYRHDHAHAGRALGRRVLRQDAHVHHLGERYHLPSVCDGPGRLDGPQLHQGCAPPRALCGYR
jgi:hypothetical protein